MLQKNKYEYQYNLKPLSEFEVYCKTEGLDPLFIISTAKKEKIKEKTKNAGRAIGHLFDKYMEHIKKFGISSLRY